MKNQTQVEKELQEFIERYLPAGKLSVDNVKQWVWEESGSPLQANLAFQEKFIGYFDGTDASIDEIIKFCMDAWNYFPHESLGGKSPEEMMGEYK